MTAGVSATKIALGFAATALSALSAGCSVMPDVPVEKVMNSSDWPKLSVPEAVATLNGSWNLCKSMSECSVQNGRALVSRFELGDQRFQFAALPPIVFSDARLGGPFSFLILGPGNTVWTGKGDDGNKAARRMASAILTLKAAWEADFSSAANESFKGVADAYRKSPQKPSLPEEARRFKLQADAAVKEKDWSRAAFVYREAVLIAPWWPEGRFNRALILGEMGDYSVAKQEMQRYLQLVPDASNARAAQDKIYVWEGQAQ